jgi:hypothetical protein
MDVTKSLFPLNKTAAKQKLPTQSPGQKHETRR